jgi:cytidine deaminase
MTGLPLQKMKKMTQMARKARDNAYAPYSNHPVGVALMTDKGLFYTGANCEIANFDGTCAEAGAIAAMATAGGRVIRAMVVIGPKGEHLCTPCGRCRQRIREFADDKTQIYSLWHDGRIGLIHSIDDLLPAAFGPDNLAEMGLGPKKTKTKKNSKRKR